MIFHISKTHPGLEKYVSVQENIAKQNGMEQDEQDHFAQRRFRIFSITFLALSLSVLINKRLYSQVPPSQTAAQDSAHYYYEMANREKNKSHLLLSIRYLEKAYEKDSSSAAIIKSLADGYYWLRMYYQAKTMYKKLESTGDTTISNFTTLLKLSYQLHHHNEVIAYAAKIKNSDPTVQVSYYPGKSSYEMGHFGDAIVHLKKAYEEDSANAEIPYLISQCYIEMAQYRPAQAWMGKAIAMDTLNSGWYYELGLIYYALKNDKEALRYMLEAGERGFPKDDVYLENLGIAFLNVGKLAEGERLLQDLLEKRPYDLTILNLMAESHFEKREYKQAIEYWDKILEFDNTNAAALYMIGISYQKKGGKDDKQKGILLCEKAIKLDPSLSGLKRKVNNLNSF